MQQERILLINPPITLREVYGEYASCAPVWPPLGLCYIASVLLRRGHEIRLLDCMAENAEMADVQEAIERFRPHLVGLTATTVSFHHAKEVVSLVKRVDTGIVTVLGGAHISAVPHRTMQECPDLDIGIRGEGEITMMEVMDALEHGRSLRGIPGVCWREEGRIVVNPPRPLLRELDQLPHPARHLLKDLERYSPNPFRGFGRAVSIISSRGCTFDCAYCDQSVFSRVWRAHSTDYVIGEITELKDRHGFDFFSFEDDHFLLNRNRVVELCRKICAADLGIGWTCSARVDSFQPEVLNLMRQAGCKIVYLGIESGSPRVLKSLNKRVTLASVRKGIEMLRRAGIRAYGSFMLGLPGETAQDIEATLEFATSLPLDAISVFLYVPYPGSSMREAAMKAGFVSGDWRDYSGHPTRPPFINDGMSEEYLLAKQAQMYRRFYLRPSYMARHFRHYLNLPFGRRVFAMLKEPLLDLVRTDPRAKPPRVPQGQALRRSR